uniref:Uncharacterized protein n=1 Tax=Anguilla anguilla TaxID=7936 RepID=A0A0E9WIH9_ANGAN
MRLTAEQWFPPKLSELTQTRGLDLQSPTGQFCVLCLNVTGSVLCYVTALELGNG